MGVAQTLYQLLLTFPLVYQEMAAKSHLTFDLSPRACICHTTMAASTYPPTNSSRQHRVSRAARCKQRAARCLAGRLSQGRPAPGPVGPVAPTAGTSVVPRNRAGAWRALMQQEASPLPLRSPACALPAGSSGSGSAKAMPSCS